MMRRVGRLDDWSNGIRVAAGGPESLVSRPVTRRKALGGLLLATAGTVTVAGLGAPPIAKAAGSTTITRNGRTATLGPVLAPDGYPQASVQGTFVGVRAPYFLVDGGTGVVPVTILPSTQVLAGGAASTGTLDALSVGDWLMNYTAILGSGERVATKIVQNPRFYRLVITAVSGSRIEGTTLPSDATPGVSVQLAINALTVFPQLSVPEVGSNVQAATISNSPSSPSLIVATRISVL